MDKKLVSQYITPLYPVPTSLGRTGKLDEKIRCILFDIYGTLFISASGDIGIAKKQSQKKQKLEQLTVKYKISKNPDTLLKELFSTIEKRHEELKKKGTDYPEVNIADIWMNVLNNSDSDMVREFAVEFEMIVNPVYPMPNLKETLNACKEQEIAMGIISNAQFYTEYLFNWFLDSDIETIGFHTDLIFFSYKFECAKPSAYLFQLAAEKLESMNIPLNSVLYVGNDMLNDICPAKDTGLKTALFAGDSRSLRLREDYAECKGVSPDLIITDLYQLPDYTIKP
ncbi:MAG: HAD family hydrolase [Desulfobacteraceae bacterium]|nr:HAD family hydrolase [Desulfobacteraceae bacterium]